MYRQQRSRIQLNSHSSQPPPTSDPQSHDPQQVTNRRLMLHLSQIKRNNPNPLLIQQRRHRRHLQCTVHHLPHPRLPQTLPQPQNPLGPRVCPESRRHPLTRTKLLTRIFLQPQRFPHPRKQDIHLFHRQGLVLMILKKPFLTTFRT